MNSNKEIQLNQKLLNNDELIMILISEIKELKDNSNKKINELMKMNEEKERKIDILENKYNNLKEKFEGLEEKIYYKDEMKIAYVAKEEGDYNIFGEQFVKNNKDNIELNINGEKSNLKDKCTLRKGENYIKIQIKNIITNLSRMFYGCKNLKNIYELQYLNTKYCTNCTGMFTKCSLLSDINSLKKCKVSNVISFAGMFSDCSSLSDISALENWNVSNGVYFAGMFSGCSSLSDIGSLEKWNVSKGTTFSNMFSKCSSLLNIRALEN